MLFMLIKSNRINSPLIIFLMGPTASGKTNLVIALQKQVFKLKIISVDSALIYKGMNIGTAKPSYSELKYVPHKLIDIRDPAECYSVSEFYYDAISEIQKIIKSDCIPVLVGGTMLYFKVLLHGLFHSPKANQNIRDNLILEARKIGWRNMYSKLRRIDPVICNKIHCHDHKRIIRALEIFLIEGKTRTELKKTSNQLLHNSKILQFAIMPSSRNILNNRIEQRFYRMLEIGFEDEVNILFNRTDLRMGDLKPSMTCVGYRQMWEYLSGSITYDQMIFKGLCATRKLAKQQLTWLRKWPNLHWVNSDHIAIAVEDVLKILLKNLI